MAVKKALFAVSAIMYKFSPREEIPLETSVSEAPPPSIIIPSDVSIYPAANFYQNPSDPLLTPRSVPPVLPELHGYGDAGSTWPVYSSALPVVSGYGGASHSEELIVRLLCPFDKIGRVIGKGGSSIKGVRQTSGARVEVDDTKNGRDECIITVTATEVLNCLLFFKVHLHCSMMWAPQLLTEADVMEYCIIESKCGFYE